MPLADGAPPAGPRAAGPVLEPAAPMREAPPMTAAAPGTPGTVVLLAGPSGAGKSTLAGRWCATRGVAVHVEYGAVRYLLRDRKRAVL